MRGKSGRCTQTSDGTVSWVRGLHAQKLKCECPLHKPHAFPRSGYIVSGQRRAGSCSAYNHAGETDPRLRLVVEAQTQEETIRLIRAEEPDLVLPDLCLGPDVHGLDILGTVRDLRPTAQCAQRCAYPCAYAPNRGFDLSAAFAPGNANRLCRRNGRKIRVSAWNAVRTGDDRRPRAARGAGAHPDAYRVRPLRGRHARRVSGGARAPSAQWPGGAVDKRGRRFGTVC